MFHLLSEVACTHVHTHTCTVPPHMTVQVEHKSKRLFTFATIMDLCTFYSFPVNKGRVKV